MPNVDDQLRALLKDAAPRPTTSGLDERLARRHRARALRRRIGRAALVVFVFAGTAAGFIALRVAFEGDTTVPGQTVSPSPSSVTDLGLGYPVCRVSSMPITTAEGDGKAYVFTRMDGQDCPTQRNGEVGVGVDVDANGGIDATAGPLTDCFLVCDLFATPDINGDGTSEVFTSNAGADGYGITTFAIRGERVEETVSLEPITVSGEGVGFVRPGPMTFGWVGAAAHRGLAFCTTTPEDGPALVIESADVGQDSTSIADTTLALSDTTATVIGTDTREVPLAETPEPGKTLCGERVRLPDGPIPAYPVPQTSDQGPDRALSIPGIPYEVCRVTSISGDFGDGLDTAWVFEEVPGGDCAGYEGFQRLAVGSDGRARETTARLTDVIDEEAWHLWAYAAADVDGDGTDEIVLARTGAHDGARHLYLFDVGDGAVAPVLDQTCGAGCRGVPWNIEIGPTAYGNGAVGDAGLYCGTAKDGSPALVYWQSSSDDPHVVYDEPWVPRDGGLAPLPLEQHRVASSAEYQPSGLDGLCGSPVERSPS